MVFAILCPRLLFKRGIRSEHDVSNATRFRTRFVDDGVDLFHHIEVSLVVGVFDSCASPWHHRELTCGELLSNISASCLKHTNK